MGLLTLLLRQSCQVSDGSGGTRTIACRAERAERVGGGGFYYQDWVLYLSEYVPYGATVTVTGDVARTVYDSREWRGLTGVVVGYKLVLGHLPA